MNVGMNRGIQHFTSRGHHPTSPSGLLVVWNSGRMSVFQPANFSVLRSTCSWWITTYILTWVSHLL